MRRTHTETAHRVRSIDRSFHEVEEDYEDADAREDGSRSPEARRRTQERREAVRFKQAEFRG